MTQTALPKRKPQDIGPKVKPRRISPSQLWRLSRPMLRAAGLLEEYREEKKRIANLGTPSKIARMMALKIIYPKYMAYLDNNKGSEAALCMKEDVQSWFSQTELDADAAPIVSEPDPEPKPEEKVEIPKPDLPTNQQRLRRCAKKLKVSEDFFERTSSAVEDIQYVAQFIDVPRSVLIRDDAPSSKAWNMLMSYREENRKKDFWDKVYTKMIPSKAQLDKANDDIEIDGNAMIRTIDRLLDIKATGTSHGAAGGQLDSTNTIKEAGPAEAPHG